MCPVDREKICSWWDGHYIVLESNALQTCRGYKSRDFCEVMKSAAIQTYGRRILPTEEFCEEWNGDRGNIGGDIRKVLSPNVSAAESFVPIGGDRDAAKNFQAKQGTFRNVHFRKIKLRKIKLTKLIN